MKRVNEKEYQYVKEVLDAQFATSKGSMMTQRLEKLFAEKFNANLFERHDFFRQNHVSRGEHERKGFPQLDEGVS